MKHRYAPYKSCVLRTPIFPYSDIWNCENIDSILSNEIFSESIYIASSSLYQKLYLKERVLTERVRDSVLRYYSRACTRPTPYGLFAGCDLLPVDEEATKSTVKLSNYLNYKTYTRIDMNILCDYIRKIEKDDKIKKNLYFHLNSTLYTSILGHNYIEYILDSNNRKYSLSLVSSSQYIDKIIGVLREKISASFAELVESLIELDVETDVAEEFLLDLIKEGILISCLEPSVIGKDYIYQIIDNLKTTNISTEPFSEIESELRNIDNIPLGQRINHYNSLAVKLSDEKNYPAIFHVDLRNVIYSGIIGNDITDLVLECANFLFSIKKKKDSPVNHFINEFYERFEEEEVPLCVALDSQVGIRYGVWQNTNGDINPLISGLPLPENRGYGTYAIDFFQQMLMDKTVEALSNGEKSIDLKNIINDNDTPVNSGKFGSFYTIFSVVAVSPTVIQMGGVVDSSYSKLVSRFQYLAPQFKDFVDSITEAEDCELDNNCIYAEILHLPEDRIGNIQMHPINRKYAIPYLSNTPSDKDVLAIPITDIMISTPKGKRIKLRSKKYGKEIYPILSTAHNYSLGLPIYAFLCELDAYNNESQGFYWGDWANSRKFLPRVYLGENIILSPAQWRLSSNDCLAVINCLSSDGNCISPTCESFTLPTTFYIVEGDNKLFVNLKISNLRKMFCNYIKNKSYVLLEECLYRIEQRGFVTNGKSSFANEILMGFHKRSK